MSIEDRLMMKLGEKDFQIAQLQAQIEELSKQFGDSSHNPNTGSEKDSQ